MTDTYYALKKRHNTIIDYGLFHITRDHIVHYTTPQNTAEALGKFIGQEFRIKRPSEILISFTKPAEFPDIQIWDGAFMRYEQFSPKEQKNFETSLENTLKSK